MRAIAVATVSFGLVDIPVRIYAAVESKAEIKFHILHGKCSSRLRQQHWCPTCEDIVIRDDQVKGYEFAKDRYVTFKPEELAQLGELEDKPVNQTIAVSHFTDGCGRLEVANVHIERAYFVGPDEGSERAFAALVKAMSNTERTAVAKYTARGKTHLVMLGAVQGDRLEMVLLRTAGEVRSIGDVPMFEPTQPAPETVRLVEVLLRQMTRDEIGLADHVDDAQRRLAEQIQHKLDGEEFVASPSATRAEPIADLVDALKQSVATAKKKRTRRAAPASP